jgi:hypothetical protein
MSPAITTINIGGFKFFFGSNEGGVIHVHVQTPSGVVKWWLGKDGDRVVSLKHVAHGVKSQDVQKSRRYTVQHYDVIVAAWETHFARHRRGSTASAFVYWIGPTGFWLYCQQELYWISYRGFPVFAGATREEIETVEQLSEEDFHWPLLDADVELESLLFPERFPLRARVLPRT